MKLGGSLLLLTGCAGAVSQAGDPSPSTLKHDVSEITSLEAQLAQAVLTRDYPQLRRIEAEGYVYTDSDAKVSTRDEFIRAYEAGTSRISLIRFDVSNVDVYENAAVVRGIVTVEREDNGVPLSRKSRYTRLYLRCPTGWCAVAGHSSSLVVMSDSSTHTSPAPMRPGLPLQLLPDTLAICRLPPDAALPAWATSPGPFLTVSRTPEELSITVSQSAVPKEVRCERDYRALRVRGTLSPNLVGILLSIAEPLAKAGLSIFAISTYDTDYVLVKARDWTAALDALRDAGHQIGP
jgi:hypothetical protein